MSSSSSQVGSHIIVVAPPEGLTVSDERLRELAFELVGAERPSPAVKTMSLLEESLGVTGVTLRATRRALGRWVDSRQLKGLELEDAHELIVELLRALLSRDVSAVVPGARVLTAGDPELGDLECLDGSFAIGSAYAAHPFDSRRFLLIAGYHEYLVNEKRSEFLAIASALGASEVTLSDARSARREVEAQAGAAVPGVEDAQLGFKAGRTSSSGAEFNLSARFGRPNSPPRMASRAVWIRREPLWQRMVEARLEGNVEEMTVDFTYDADSVVSASLAATLEGIGVGIGGRFRSAQTLRQSYTVKFYPREHLSP